MYSIMQSPGYNWCREYFHNEHNIMFLSGNYNMMSHRSTQRLNEQSQVNIIR